MDAGTGAYDQARRHEQHLAELETERAAVDARIAAARNQQKAWTAGAEGERRVAAQLELLGPGWRVLHDVHWPGRPKANLDHVAIGPTGVWVIDAKNWTGRVTVTDGVLRQNGYRRTDNTDAASQAAAAVAALLQPFRRMLVQPVVCLAGEGAQLSAQQSTSATRVVGLDSLLPLLASGPARLLPGEVDALAQYLTDQLGGTRSPTLVTTAKVLSPSTAPVHEPPHRTRRALAARPPRRTTPRRTASPTPPRPPARAARPTSSRRARSSPLAGALSQLLRVAVVLVLMWGMLATLPTWAPIMSEVVSDGLLQQMPDSVSTSVPSTPTPAATP